MAITHTTDHVAQALARLAEQYRGTNVEGLVTAFAQQAQYAEDGLYALVTDTTIDAAVGVQLDVLGRIVASRGRVATIPRIACGSGLAYVPTAATALCAT